MFYARAATWHNIRLGTLTEALNQEAVAARAAGDAIGINWSATGAVSSDRVYVEPGIAPCNTKRGNEPGKEPDAGGLLLSS